MRTEGAIISEDKLPLVVFLQSLMTEGRALVSSRSLAGEADMVAPLLEQLEKVARTELSGEPPAFSPPVALWAARLLYQLCQLTVCRDKGEEEISAAGQIPCPARPGPETDWSADILLRHLPDLFQMARHVGSGDPLVRQMKILAAQWPLSSVGIPEVPGMKAPTFMSHPVLLRLYADRVLEASAHERLGPFQLEEILRGDLRAHRDLAPDLARRLFAEAPPECADSGESNPNLNDSDHE